MAKATRNDNAVSLSLDEIEAEIVRMSLEWYMNYLQEEIRKDRADIVLKHEGTEATFETINNMIECYTIAKRVDTALEKIGIEQ